MPQCPQHENVPKYIVSKTFGLNITTLKGVETCLLALMAYLQRFSYFLHFSHLLLEDINLIEPNFTEFGCIKFTGILTWLCDIWGKRGIMECVLLIVTTEVIWAHQKNYFYIIVLEYLYPNGNCLWIA